MLACSLPNLALPSVPRGKKTQTSPGYRLRVTPEDFQRQNIVKFFQPRKQASILLLFCAPTASAARISQKHLNHHFRTAFLPPQTAVPTTSKHRSFMARIKHSFSALYERNISIFQHFNNSIKIMHFYKKIIAEMFGYFKYFS